MSGRALDFQEGFKMSTSPSRATNTYTRFRRGNSRPSRPWLWLALGVVFVFVIVSILPSSVKNDTSNETAPQRSAKKINKPTQQDNNAIQNETIPSAQMEKPTQIEPVIPVGNVVTARTAKIGRVMTLMDGTIVTNIVERPFKRDLEHSLWVALRPGNMGAGLLTTLQNRHSEQEIIQMLKEMTVPEPGDSEGLARIKREVQELKERILLALDSGRTLPDVFDEIRNQGILESKINAETMRLRAEAIRTGDAQQIRDTVQQANELRQKQGLEPLAVPEEFLEDEESTYTQATYSEFDESGDQDEN